MNAHSNSGRNRSLDTYLRDVNRYPLLSREEEHQLALRTQGGDRAAEERLINSNLRFVVSVARRYVGQGLPIEDLINAGNLGLVKAARRFDPGRGFKFITYAVWWIRQSMLQSLAENSRLVRLPVNRINALQRISKASSHLDQELGRKATAEDIAQELDLPEVAVTGAIELDSVTLSLDDAGDDDARGLVETLKDPRVADPAESMYQDELSEGIKDVLRSLNDREYTIMTLYFGLNGDEPLTLEEIGQQLGLTRERIRQIKEKAIEKLRHKSRARHLLAYLGDDIDGR
jgi:RNA polymerase primary sigma factor